MTTAHVATPAPTADPALGVVIPTHLIPSSDGERELQALLPLQAEYDKAYRISERLDGTRKGFTYSQQNELLLLWHERLGHLNMKDVAELIGLPQQSKWSTCISCIKGKSRRQPLTGSSGSLRGCLRHLSVDAPPSV